MNNLYFTLVIDLGGGKMGNKVNLKIVYSSVVGALMLLQGFCFASENNITIINNVYPQNYSIGYGGGVLCTEYGGICATGRYMMSTARVRYVPPQWKRQTIRERRLSEGLERVPYAYKQAYYR